MKKTTVYEKDIGRRGKMAILLTIPTVFFLLGGIYGIIFEGIENVACGLYNIIVSPTILVTDFLKVGGIGATLINAAFVGIINVYLIHRYRLKVNGVLIAAFFTVMGFAFFGKNIYNILPIYLGGYLYTRYQKISFKNVIAVVMFGTALSPLISEISFAGFLHPKVGFVVAILVGIFIGFIIVPLSSHMLKFHEGFNLYNIGFTAGIIGTVFTSILRSFSIVVEPVHIVYDRNDEVLITLVVVIIIALTVTGIYINPNGIKEYKKICTYKGRLITDFTHLVGYGITCLNMAILGVVSLTLVLIMGATVNGPVLAGIFTVMGFGAFGKHPKNVLPIMLGVILASVLLGQDLSTTGIVIAVLFSSTLAPITGHYGVFIGMLAGMLHMVLVTNVGVIHGGINLYNNGFSGGIVAGVFVPVIDAFKKGKK